MEPIAPMNSGKLGPRVLRKTIELLLALLLLNRIERSNNQFLDDEEALQVSLSCMTYFVCHSLDLYDFFLGVSAYVVEIVVLVQV